jgi:hypothetical protein
MSEEPIIEVVETNPVEHYNYAFSLLIDSMRKLQDSMIYTSACITDWLKAYEIMNRSDHERDC